MHKAFHEKYNHGMPGVSTLAHAPAISELCKNSLIKSILDYGCGKGRQYKGYYKDVAKKEYIQGQLAHHIWKSHFAKGIMPTLYDPCVEWNNERPQRMFDLVICIDVLEHVPEDGVDFVLDDIFNYAQDAAYISISTRPAGKMLPSDVTNGVELNAHLTVQPKEWWLEKVVAARLRLKQEKQRSIYTKVVFDED